MATSAFCASEFPVRRSLCEPSIDPNRVTNVIMAFDDATITETSGTTIITSAIAAEKACQAVIFREVNGTYDGGSFADGPGRGRQVTRVTGATHTLTFTDFEATDNIGEEDDFYNKLMSGTTRIKALYFTTATLIFKVTDTQFTIKANTPVTDDPNVEITGNVVTSWSKKRVPTIFRVDTAPLEVMPDLGALTLTNFGAAAATIVGTEVSISDAATLEVKAAFADGATSYALDSAAEAAGLTINPTNGEISGTHTGGVGIYTITVEGTNDCGITGSQTFTLEVTA